MTTQAFDHLPGTGSSKTKQLWATETDSGVIGVSSDTGKLLTRMNPLLQSQKTMIEKLLNPIVVRARDSNARRSIVVFCSLLRQQSAVAGRS